MVFVFGISLAIAAPAFIAAFLELSAEYREQRREMELWRSGGIVKENFNVRVEQSVARRSHKPKVSGSNPAPATIWKGRSS